MNKKQVFFASLLCLGSLGSVQAQEMNRTGSGFRSAVELTQGYRNDNLNLKVRHHDRAKYKNIDTWTTRVGYMAEKDDMFFTGFAGVGDVYDGRLHRSHHHHHSRKVNGDYTADFSALFGKRFAFDNGWYLAPMVGYGVYFQDFHTKHHSKERLKALWYAPQFALCLKKDFSDNLKGYINYTLLYPLSLQTKTRKHSGGHTRTVENKAYDSAGNILTVGLNWMFASNWSLRPEIEGMEFYSNGAHHKSGHAHRSAIEYRLVLNYAF